MTKKIIYIIFFLSIITFLFSCLNTDKQKQQENLALFNDSLTEKDTFLVYTKYDLPLPVNLYHFLKNKNLAFIPELLIPLENIKNQITNTDKAIYMGFYSSDLAYCNIFEQNQEIINYYAVLKKTSMEFSIDSVYSDNLIERLEKNKENLDSLYYISTGAYWKACKKLEVNGQINILPFVIIGSWIESMYLISFSPETEKHKKELFNKIVEQEKSLDNLIQYAYKVMTDSNTFEAIDDMQILIKQLRSIKNVYKSIYKYENKRLMKKDDFNKFKKEIENIRDFYL